MYICRYWDWGQYGIEKPRWVPRTSQFPHYDNPPYWTGMGKVEQEAAELVNKGCRNVRIVTIHGSTPPSPPSPEAKPDHIAEAGKMVDLGGIRFVRTGEMRPAKSGEWYVGGNDSIHCNSDSGGTSPVPILRPVSVFTEPQPVEAGWRRALEMIGDERRTTGATIDGLRSIAREALSKAPQPPDIQPESSQQPASNQQEDDREWRKVAESMPPSGVRVLVRHKDGTENEDTFRRTNRKTGWDLGSIAPRGGIQKWKHLPKPPDSKPPTQSEDKWKPCCEGGPVGGHAHGCPTLCSPSPTKPTQSVQPWPEDLSVLVGRTITTRGKSDHHDRNCRGKTDTCVVERVDGEPDWLTVNGGTCGRCIRTGLRDLLSVSPPLESKPESVDQGFVNMLDRICPVPKPQSVQSEGKGTANPLRDAVSTLMIANDGVLDQLMVDCPAFVIAAHDRLQSCCARMLPKFSQPKDSKDIPAELLAMAGTSPNTGCYELMRRAASALKSANERAEAAEKNYHDLIMAVAQKFPNETRHETAKRYIIERENKVSEPGQSKAL